MICNFSPVAFNVFGFPIHWYSLAYIFGMLIAVELTKFLSEKDSKYYDANFQSHIPDFINYAVIGIIFGGRLGHVLFYDFEYYMKNFAEILKVWKGGMSFFGGFLGTIFATYVFCKKHKIAFLKFIDLWSVSVPVGLFLGRVANFINGELLGKESAVRWCVIFRDGIPRHPSQLYEAFFEGIALFFVMVFTFYKKCYRFPGRLSGIFCIGYGIARFIGEFFREPDSFLSYKLFYYTNLNFNQYLSILIIVLGIILVSGMCGKKHE